jgi:hypothetical protein
MVFEQTLSPGAFFKNLEVYAFLKAGWGIPLLHL